MRDRDATTTGLHAAADIAPGAVLGGRYRIESILGIGGMGVVYRAYDQALDVPVALKLLRPELAHRPDVFERFRQELLLARQVSSPHVARIHDLAQHDGRWLLSMDYVAGESLDRRLDRDGPLDVEDAVRIARQVALGLAAAHARGVIHRDLKPANILLDAQGAACISDFGVARSLATRGATTQGATHSGAVVGTPDYLSPEQARGDHVDARSDLYALGLILYEMLTGRLPFADGTVAEVLAQRILRQPESVDAVRPGLPRWLVRLIDRLLRVQPAHRLQDADAVIAVIDRRELARDFRPRRPVLLAMVATLALVAVVAGGWWYWRVHAPHPAAPSVQSVSAPLDRLLVLPVSGSGDQARDAGLTAHLRDALWAVPGFAVVDAGRTRQALRSLDPSGDAQPEAAALQRSASAQRILQPTLIDAQGRWRLHATVLATGTAPVVIEGPDAPDPTSALTAWLSAPNTTRALTLREVPRSGLPASASALAAYGAGLQARAAGQLDTALDELRQAAASDPRYTAAWLEQSVIAQQIGAREQAADAAVNAQNAGEHLATAMRGRLAAQRAIAENNPQNAATHWRAQIAATPDDTQAQLDLARALGATGDFAGAARQLEALTKRDPGDPRAWFEFGKLAILQGKTRIAVDDYLTRALVAFKRSRDLFGEAETVNALGVGYANLGQTKDAAEQYRKAIDLRERMGNRRGVATSLRNLANMLTISADLDGADTALQQARAINIELGDQEGRAAIDNELGLLAEERGNYPGALKAFRSALQIWQRLGDLDGIAEAQNNIGFAQYQLGNYADAQAYWQQAQAGYESLSNQDGRTRLAQNLGLLALARGNWDQARELFDQSLVSAGRHQLVQEAAVSRRNLADLELQQGHLRAAIEQARRAESVFESRQDIRGKIDAQLLRAEALLAARADKQAGAVLTQLERRLTSASTEQRAIAELSRARLATHAGDLRAAGVALTKAARLAEASGVRSLQLRIALAAAGDDRAKVDALDEATASLGHVSLRLEWLAQHIRQALRAGDTTAANAAYDEAAALLRSGHALPAYRLHRLGAQVRAARDDAAGAAAARTRAQEALVVLREGLPEAQRAGFDRALATAQQQQP